MERYLPSLATLALVAALCPAAALAHETRPAYLEITETSPGRFDLLWRTPINAGMPLPVLLQLPHEVRPVTPPHVVTLSDSLVERRVIDAPGGLAGRRIAFAGLEATITDVLVRIQTHDGGHSTTLVHPSRPWIEIAAARGPLAVAGAYLAHGVEHILLGYDHLLFVLALVLIVRSPRVLLVTITSFTLAHSITLALATLDVVRLPGPPVEAAIALSSLLLACEIVRQQRGQESLTARWPWVVAFTFGLLHGFGFACALAQVGLPRGDVPLALLAFNVGVELGQLAFIAAVFALAGAARWLRCPPAVERRSASLATAMIGVLGAFWFFERLARF